MDDKKRHEDEQSIRNQQEDAQANQPGAQQNVGDQSLYGPKESERLTDDSSGQRYQDLRANNDQDNSGENQAGGTLY